MGINEYNKKRKFGETPEPEGKVEESGADSPLHFVVQKHHASHLHYDFRLELDGVLKSWAVPKGPSLDPAVKRLAMMVEDHPVSYMKFEGSIPKGNYGAGDVIVWDFGVYHSAKLNTPKENEEKLKRGLAKGHIKFVLFGDKLKGQFSLAKIGKAEENTWILTKLDDEFARPESEFKVADETASVLSGNLLPSDEAGSPKIKETKIARAKTETKKKKIPAKEWDPMPHKVKPMLATLVDKPFDKAGWIFEIKWDGYRAVAEVAKSEVKLYSRNGLSFNDKYPDIIKTLEKIEHDVVLDGEVVALDNEGKSNFHSLQYYDQKKVPLRYVVFDILFLDGKNLEGTPLIERKKILKDLMEDMPGLMYGDFIEEKGVAFFEQAKKHGLEGIVAKESASTYRQGQRGTQWLKIKNEMVQEAIIVGFTEPRGSREKLGSLVLAVKDGDGYKYIGHSGGGFTQEGLNEIYEMLLPLIVEKSPLDEKVPINSPITWVKPKLVCEIKFTEWTPDGRMRHPIFLGMREDKKADEVVYEKEQPREIILNAEPAEKPKYTHTDKVFWPEEGFTKGDVIEYYDKISDVILPYLKDRPESMNRHPNGITKPNFFQKNIETEVPDFVTTHKIWSESNEAEINYLICNNKDTLLYMANLGCIELNPWNSRIENLDKPDFMIVDLDPGNVSFKDLIKVALTMRETLEMACQHSIIKTSGKRGLHIVVPLGAKYDYDQIRNFSQLLVTIVNHELPDVTSIERSPSKRKDKIYLDFLQNRRGQTLAAPYSLRPWKGATVSTPLKWEEVTTKLDPSKFNIKTIFKRLEEVGDLWKPVLTEKIDLKESINCLEKHLAKKNKK